MPRLISSIRESQSATTPSEKFRAQSRLIRDSHAVIEPATRLVDVARAAVIHVPDTHMATNLQQSSQALSESISDLRVALNHAQQLNFSQQLVYSEELIKELNEELLEVQRAAKAGRLQPLHSYETSHTSTSALMGAARQVGSTLAQLVSASVQHDRQHIGASAVEAAQALRTFTSASRSVCATRKDVDVDNFIVQSRSVVHDAGGVFNRVREDAGAAQLADSAKQVSTSLRKCVAYLPQQAQIETAIQAIRTINTGTAVREPDVRRAAGRLVEASSDLVVAVRAPQHQESVNVFVNTYTDFHTSVMQSLPAVRDQPTRIESLEALEEAREHACEVLKRAEIVSTDARPDAAHSQTLETSRRQLVETVAVIVERVSQEGKPWEAECDAALRQIKSVRHLVSEASLPVNDNSYFGSLEEVTKHARTLGESLTGIAHNAKSMETRREDSTAFCRSVRQSSDAICSLAEAAAQSAYLVGVAHPKSVRGIPAIVDGPRINRSAVLIVQACERIERNQGEQKAVLEDMNEIGKNITEVASLCRDSSERTSAVTVKKQFINEAANLTRCATDLFNTRQAFETRPNSVESFAKTSTAARALRETVHSLQAFVERPDFAAKAAAISHEGKQGQIPVLSSTRRMLDTSAEMIVTARALAAEPGDKATWHSIAATSKDVSDSIKSLVAAIRDAAPGQVELDTAIQRLEHLIQAVERIEIDAVNAPSRPNVQTERRVHQQIIHGTQSLSEKIEGLRVAACKKGEELASRVEEQWSATQSLAQAACEAAETTSDSRTQHELFQQTRTVIEAELEMMRASKEAGGNENAREAHGRVDEAAHLYREALHDMHSFVNRISSEQGVTHGMVETITRSIALTDAAARGGVGDAGRSFADAQTNMTTYLEEIQRTAVNLPTATHENLPPLSLHLSETFKKLAEESHQAIQLSAPEQAQRLKVAVQRLGSACIDCVKKVGNAHAHRSDSMARREMNDAAAEVIERVREVLAALHHGSKGTQACIHAANTVSGIIGDLDTTILFATSGSLHGAAAPGDFASHRDDVIKTAKALIEDTKALVAGAASNQEQLAVAAQNAVRTMIVLTDVVKTGALSLSSEHSSEGQVSVMHACRDVAAALSSLIHATKNASGKSLRDPAMDNLKHATKTMIKNVTSLLQMVKNVEDTSNMGTVALEAAEEAIAQEIAKFEHDSGEGPSHLGGGTGHAPVSSEHLIRSARGVTEAAGKLAGVGSSLDNESAVAAANLGRATVSELLKITRLAAYETETAEARFRIINAGREVALQVRSVMRSVHGVLRYAAANQDVARPREAVYEASRALAGALRDLTGCCDLIKEDAPLEPMDATAIAENELHCAANAIQAAAVKLAELRPRKEQQKVDENMTFDEAILSSAQSITRAVHTLVQAASDAQRELVAQGRAYAQSNGKGHGADYQWSEGLISAARFVAAAVQQLCEAANLLVQGQASEERLISAAKQVASSTAQLLIACNVRADQNSQANRRLQAAGAAVKNATERLVAAARQLVEADDRTVVISERLVSGIAQVMDAKEAVLRKERELVEARERLAKLNQSRYEKGLTPEE